MTSAARSLVALGLGLCLSCAAGAADRHPYHLAVETRWGPGAGSDAFRADVGRALSESFAGGCFAEVSLVEDARPATEADLLLVVVLSGVEDETRFEDSIATALQPGEPSKELRRVAHFEVVVDATLQSPAGGVVQSKRLVASISRRPVMVGEDPQMMARSEAVDRIVADLTKTYCKGGDKLERKIKAALAAPAEGPTPR